MSDDEACTLMEEYVNATLAATDWHQPPFRVTVSAFPYLPAGIVVATLCYIAFRNIPTPANTNSCSLVVTASLGLFCSISGLVPFLTYSLTGKSWTGTQLNHVHQYLIESRHAIPMYAWSVLSILQTCSVLLRFPTIHKISGKIAFYLVIPSMLLELHANAVFVFLPEKPRSLARVVLQKHQPSDFEIILFAISMSFALVLPAQILLYSVLSYRKLRQRNIVLHKTFALMLIISTFSAGSLRYLFRVYYKLANCKQFENNDISIAVQAMALAKLPLLYIPFVTFIFILTVPKDLRLKEPSVFWGFVCYLIPGLTTVLFSYWLRIPWGITCDV